MTVADLAIRWTEQGHLPDAVVRAGIRRLLKERLAEIGADDAAAAADLAQAFADTLPAAPLAPLPHKANEQHYELPADFFAAVLGKHLKYSACWWPDGSTTLDEAEAAALEETCRRAGIEDGQDILELGCGWGALSLWILRRYPGCRVTAVSNSASQRAWIEAAAAREGLQHRLQVTTCDINHYEAPRRHDRIVSVEMFEHLRNWPAAFARVHRWLQPDGRFFLHVFAHRDTPYAFVARDESDWMSRHFFSGGMMPSDDLALRFQDDLRLLRRWRWDGTHYERTANAWLARMDAQRDTILPLFERCYGPHDAALWWSRWRIFFMSCAELFGYEHGQQWRVCHYLFAPRGA